MKCIRQIHERSVDELSHLSREPVALTIGNFDGLHQGHMRLLTCVRHLAQKAGIPSALLSFSPSPSAFFRQDYRVIQPWRDRLKQLSSMGIDRVYLLRFNKKLAAYSAQDFFHQVICDRIHARHVVIGDDFHFGYRRQGSPEWLMNYGVEQGIDVTCIPALCEDGRRISSTWIREALQASDMETATRLLGRPYAIEARVHRGDQRGRLWGFPTANLYPKTTPWVRGVFAVQVECAQCSGLIPAVANVGVRPTVANGTRLSVEVHLLVPPTDGALWNLYGQRIRVHFLQAIRAEQRFEDFNALRAQIQRDVDVARLIHGLSS